MRCWPPRDCLLPCQRHARPPSRPPSCRHLTLPTCRRLAGATCLFAYLYLRPLIRRGLGSASRGYINYSAVYICWLLMAVFYHLPSLESMGGRERWRSGVQLRHGGGPAHAASAALQRATGCSGTA